LAREHRLERCDLIQIDAEGFDGQIVRTIDFQAVQPSIVRFEHVHLSNRECDDCIELLASHGFRFIGQRRDIIAVREI
ncbi:MAG TPA: FkbM family methyltransferase, partial [Gemmatimonadales bacterium]